ncbi:uncharacterized protein LOC115229665 [Octopus sinensis]|uniref:Uncharacterized protein LOC115229665 n=1 Tax=Octopus sinensis TaxID=2607531 RepID=A0A6P7U4K5_9MOLL|nr:uncharacterized protein LOC115229665 [Octopus sinensis]
MRLDMSNYKTVLHNPTLSYIFLGYVLRRGRASELVNGVLTQLFALLVDCFTHFQPAHFPYGLPVLAYQIYSLFLHEHSPLHILHSEGVARALDEGHLEGLFDTPFEDNLHSLTPQLAMFFQEGNHPLTSDSDTWDKYRGTELTDVQGLLGRWCEGEGGVAVAMHTLFMLKKVGRVGQSVGQSKAQSLRPKHPKYSTLLRKGRRTSHTMVEVEVSKAVYCGVCGRLIWGNVPQAWECLSECVCECADCGVLVGQRCGGQKCSLGGQCGRRKGSGVRVESDSDLEYPGELPSLESVLGSEEYKALNSTSRKVENVLNGV